MNTTEQLINLKEGYIHRLKSLAIPTNDQEYLDLVFKYTAMKQELKSNITDALFLRSDIDEATTSFAIRKFQTLSDEIDKIYHEKMQQVDFKPRLKQYLDQFQQEERSEIEKYIVFYLRALIGTEYISYMSVLAFCKRAEINPNFVLSLSKNHRLYTDQFIKFSEDSLNTDKSAYEKDLIFITSIYKLFAGIALDDEDLTSLYKSPLLSFFGIEADEIANLEISDIDTDNKSFDSDNAWKDEEDEEEFDLEGLLDDVEESSVSELETMDENFKGYKSNKEYIVEEGKWISALVAKKKIEKDNYSYDKEKLPELNRQLEHYRSTCIRKLQLSRQNGFTPKLIALAEKLKLSDFQLNILKMLLVWQLPFNDDRGFELTVKEILLALLVDEIEMLNAKAEFLSKAKLRKYDLISVDTKFGLDTNIFDCYVNLDARLTAYLQDDASEISDFVKGSVFFDSSIQMDRVILPKETKMKLSKEITNHPKQIKVKKAMGIDQFVQYGNSLVFLFVGPSGTGKTMLSYAVANELGKKLLLFDFSNFSQLSSLTNEDKVFSLLFREARIKDAILFFDESELLLSERFNDLLIEIEKHNGIVIFATNAEFRINEAMRRRINSVIQFKEPGPQLRKEIWESHIPEAMVLDDNVDINLLASKYELNGGLIKNAVMGALRYAVSEDSAEIPIIKQIHLETAAREQLQNKLFLSRKEEEIIPKKGFDDLVLEEEVRSGLVEIANYEKAKKVLKGEWGFNGNYESNSGTIALFYGPSGTGKTLAAEAIAYETGKQIKLISLAQVVSKYVGDTEKNLEQIFKDMSSEDTIFLFDEADAIFSVRTEVNSSNDRYANMTTDYLLSLLERNNVFAILTTNAIDNIDPAFLRRIDYTLAFDVPDEAMCKQLWELLMPAQLPLADDVKIDKLAKQYRFNGGQIKKAIKRAAIKKALVVDEDRKITMDDFVQVCDELSKVDPTSKGQIGFKTQ